MRQRGDKVRFTGASDDQVRWGNNDDPRSYLFKGQICTVLEEEVHSWHTKIRLLETPTMLFNNVSFEDVE